MTKGRGGNYAQPDPSWGTDATGFGPGGEEEPLLADTVEFIVNSSTKVNGDEVKTEDVGLGSLEYIGLYREGEFVTEYCRGEDIQTIDLDVVRDAAEKAGIYLEETGDGGLAVPS